MSLSVDVLIVGGGVAGCIAALQLVGSGVSACLIVRATPARNACEILSPEAVLGLSSHGISSCDFELAGSKCFGVISEWGTETEVIDFGLWRCMEGWFLDREMFNKCLQHAVTTKGGLIINTDSAIRVEQSDAGFILLQTRTGSVIACGRFLIEATGRGGGLKGAGRKWLRNDRLVAVRGFLDEITIGGAWMRVGTCQSGWWYSSYPEGRHAEVVLLTDIDLLPSSELLSEWFSAELRDAGFSQWQAIQEDPLAVLDARTRLRIQETSDRSLLVGDAAFCIDPLSGSGIARAIKMAIDAVQAITDCLSTGATHSIEHLKASGAAQYERLCDEQRHVYSQAYLTPKQQTNPFWRRRI